MPELPEVEAVKYYLERTCLGARVEECAFLQLTPRNRASKRSLSHIFHPFPSQKNVLAVKEYQFPAQQAYVEAYLASIEAFFKHLEGKVLNAIVRRGKYLMLYFRQRFYAKAGRAARAKGGCGDEFTLGSDKECILLVHFKMAGRFILAAAPSNYQAPKTHIHLALKLALRTLPAVVQARQATNMLQPPITSPTLLYSDTRFGELLPVGTDAYFRRALPQLKEAHRVIFQSLYKIAEQRLAKLGLEPLAHRHAPQKLLAVIRHAKVKTPKQTLYAFLMDSTQIVGIGNIYANEINHRARLYPLRSLQTLTHSEERLWVNSLLYILSGAVLRRGTSLDKKLEDERSSGFSAHFRLPDQQAGTFARVLKVYGREKLSCLRRNCSGAIVKERFQGRSVYFCLKCQPVR